MSSDFDEAIKIIGLEMRTARTEVELLARMIALKVPVEEMPTVVRRIVERELKRDI